MPEYPIEHSVTLSLPEWFGACQPQLEQTYATDTDKMRLAIELSRRNVEEGTGGPFGAAIFDAEDGTLISVGVNQVVPLNNSTAHAEMMAFMLAQKRLRQFRLHAADHHFVLATSAQPCAMCYGASVWTGIDTILIGARREDVEGLTEFDEGPMPHNWIEALRKRGITVRRDILREEACQVLSLYEEAAGIRY